MNLLCPAGFVTEFPARSLQILDVQPMDLLHKVTALIRLAIRLNRTRISVGGTASSSLTFTLRDSTVQTIVVAVSQKCYASCFFSGVSFLPEKRTMN